MKEMLTVVGGIFPGRSWLGGSGRAYCEADVPDMERHIFIQRTFSGGLRVECFMATANHGLNS